MVDETKIVMRRRVNAAQKGIDTYVRNKNSDPYDDARTQLTELLVDLKHLATARGLSFAECLEHAEETYKAET